MINHDSSQLWLVDFEMSTMLTCAELTATSDSQVLETTAYISPEQAGRMNRLIDVRSDLYSLGVTLFELFSGELPFDARDPIEMVQAHIAIARRRLDQANAFCPEFLSVIVDRLLQKTPEERYHSAAALKNDLLRVRKLAYQKKTSEEFKANIGPTPRSLRVPQRLFGRDKECEKLIDSFRRVANGACEVIWMSGHSGLGKTALVEAARHSVFCEFGVDQRQWFVKGKFDQSGKLYRLLPLDRPLNIYANRCCGWMS